ncbi:MAG: hypothetical protein C5B54_08225 [Acidobacteria bacterium]|nr:MAG: hypothetical protein C5B54_08225 [Acidobacteriota bacterium]
MFKKFIVLLGAVLIAVPVFGGVEMNNGLLTVHVENSKLGKLAKDIESAADVKIILEQENLSDSLVSADFKDYSLIGGIKEIMKGIPGVNYVFLTNSTGHLESALISTKQDVDLSTGQGPAWSDTTGYLPEDYYPPTYSYVPPSYSEYPSYGYDSGLSYYGGHFYPAYTPYPGYLFSYYSPIFYGHHDHFNHHGNFNDHGSSGHWSGEHRHSH